MNIKSLNKHVVLVGAVCLGLVLQSNNANAQSAQSLSTQDYLYFSKLSDSKYEEANNIPCAGLPVIVTVSLNGSNEDLDRRYTAFNLDMDLPYGIEVSTDDGDGSPIVGIPSDFSLYASSIRQLSHSVSAQKHSDGSLRVVGFSSSNAEFKKTEGDLFEMQLYVSTPYVKPGANIVNLTGQNLTTKADAQKYIPADRQETLVVEEGDVSISIAIPSTIQYSTIALPFDADIPNGIFAFSCYDHEGNQVYLTPAERLEAYKPYIIYAPTGYSGKLTGRLSADMYQERVDEYGMVRDGYLNAAIKPQEISNGYVLQDIDNEVKFYFCNGNTFLIPSGKCWLNISNSQAKSLAFVIKESETGIDKIISPSVANKICYDLNGRSVNSDSKIIITSAGKKKVVIHK